MKKVLIPIIAIALILAGLVFARSSTYSASGLPYPDPTKDGPPPPKMSVCGKTAANIGYLMRKAWEKNLNSIIVQEKPTSEKVDDGYESLRTYHCWLDYLCEAVQYSGSASESATLKDTKNPGSGQRPLTTGEINQVPGCTSPDGIEIPDMKLEYIPACKALDVNTVAETQTNYLDCRMLVEREFAGDPNGKSDFDPSASLAFITLNNSLRSDSADGELKPLREKFSSILLKMLAMEDHMTTLKEQVLTLDKKLPCYVGKCD